YPFRRISRLQIADRRERSQRITRAPERFRRLAGAQLAAVPDRMWMDAAQSRRTSEIVGRCTSDWRKRLLRIFLWAERGRVMDEIDEGVVRRRVTTHRATPD